MKLLSSPSCSSSSSTFDANVCNPRAAATPSCLSGILHRILCSGSLPTHPSDHIAEETNSVKSDDKALQVKDATNEAKPTAGIVARLMGLDSMPEMKQNHKSITRSQSMNSLEHFYKHLEGKHEQVRTTMSFREKPTFLELENEDYFILSFEEETKTNEFNFKQRKEEDKYKNRESNKTEKPKTKNKRYDPEEAKEFIQIDLKQNKKSRNRVAKNKSTSRISTKNRHGRNPTRKVESECSSDELSPVSVLDSSQFLRDLEESTLLSGLIFISSTNPNSDSSIRFSNSLNRYFSGDAPSKSPINPRRKLSPELEISQSPSRNEDDLIHAKTRVIDRGIQRERYEEEICKITEMELGKSNWKFNKICEEREDYGIGGIIEDFDSYVLEGLIDEFVEQMYDLIFI